MAAKLREASTIDNTRKRNIKYKEILDSYATKNDAAALRSFVDFMIEREDKPMLTEFASACMKMEGAAEVQEELYTYTIKTLESRVGFDGEAGEVRKAFSLLLEDMGRTKEAAMCLSKIKMDGTRNVPDLEKFQIYLKIAMLYLSKKDDISAESYVTRANLVVDAVTDPVLLNAFVAVQAKVLDLQSQFLPAFHKYYQLSHDDLLEEGRMNSLGSALICAVLSDAGTLRSRALATLFKDARSPNLPAYSMLEKMHLGRIVRLGDLEVFKKTLDDHHQLKTRTEGTLLQRATREHNILACQKVYKNITFQQLGEIIDVPPEEAENICVKMIIADRLAGTIDQAERMILFTEGDTMQTWDRGITAVCDEVSRIVAILPQK